MSHAQLVQNVKDALEALLADADVPASQTREELQSIKDEVDSMIESIPDAEDE